MTYFVALMFSYVLDGEEFETLVWFRDEVQCERALRASDAFYAETRTIYPDSMIACVQTDIVSGYALRPKARPKKDGET